MTECRWHGYRLEVDGKATAAWYAQAGEWGCTCGHCRNFLALARERQLPGEILSILDGLAVPPEKATYVCELYTDGEKGVLYQFGWRIAGKVLEPADEGLLRGGKKFLWGEMDLTYEIYPYGAPGFPESHFDLECTMFLPWVLDEPMDGPEQAP